MRLSLRFKWIATLLLASLVGVALVGLFAYRTTTAGYDRLRSQQAQAAFVSAATSYYQQYHNWDGLDAYLHRGDGSGGSQGGFGPPNFYALADQNGTVWVDSGPFHEHQTVSADVLKQGTPITVDGQQVGTALLAAPPPGLDPRERDYLNSTNQALIFGALGASLAALLIGILLSQAILRPLTDLTRAITGMRHGELSQQVRVRSQDELGVLARAFNDMSAEIHRANQLRKQMTADIAHDLRTPLLVISGYIEALQDGTLKPTPERLAAMNQEAALLKRLIDDLRTLSLSDAGELKLVRQAVPPRDLLEQVRQSFEPMARERGISLKVEAEADLPELEIDRDRMAQVLGNLINNALRYTPAEGSVTLLARRSGAAVDLVTEDTGAGIAEDKLPDIFERFYRADDARSDGESGLGLAIAKSIVEAHGGSIAAESRLGEGTSIVIRLAPVPS